MNSSTPISIKARGVHRFGSRLIGLFGSGCSVKKKFWVITENRTEPKISITEPNREPNRSSVRLWVKTENRIFYLNYTIYIFFEFNYIYFWQKKYFKHKKVFFYISIKF